MKKSTISATFPVYKVKKWLLKSGKVSLLLSGKVSWYRKSQRNVLPSFAQRLGH